MHSQSKVFSRIFIIHTLKENIIERKDRINKKTGNAQLNENIVHSILFTMLHVQMNHELSYK